MSAEVGDGGLEGGRVEYALVRSKKTWRNLSRARGALIIAQTGDRRRD